MTASGWTQIWRTWERCIEKDHATSWKRKKLIVLWMSLKLSLFSFSFPPLVMFWHEEMPQKVEHWFARHLVRWTLAIPANPIKLGWIQFQHLEGVAWKDLLQCWWLRCCYHLTFVMAMVATVFNHGRNKVLLWLHFLQRCLQVFFHVSSYPGIKIIGTATKEKTDQ